MFLCAHFESARALLNLHSALGFVSFCVMVRNFVRKSSDSYSELYILQVKAVKTGQLSQSKAATRYGKARKLAKLNYTFATKWRICPIQHVDVSSFLRFWQKVLISENLI